MRKALVLIVLAVLVLVIPSATAAAAALTCHSGRTLMSSAQVRVFKLSGRWYACWFPRRRVRSLGDSGDPPDAAGEALIDVSTRWVTWSSVDCGFDDDVCRFTVYVMDVRTGKRVFTSRLPDAAGTESLLLGPRGRPAWIERSTATTRVVIRSRNGSRRVLDDSRNVAPGSLALSGSRLYWLRDGQPQTAAMD